MQVRQDGRLNRIVAMLTIMAKNTRCVGHLSS
jgi:hypothetical protein